MQRYIGTKLIDARPMTRAEYNAYRGWELPADENGADAGFLVEYLDGGQANHADHAGYISWSPMDVFRRAYRPATGMTFGLALEALKAGQKVARAGWNGKGLWLHLISSELLSPDEASTLPYIVMCYPHDAKTTPGAVVPWLASQTDMLAEDWTIME